MLHIIRQTSVTVAGAVAVPPTLEPTRQVLRHLIDHQIADVADSLVDGERCGTGGRQPHVGQAQRAVESAKTGGAAGLGTADVRRQTAAAERVLARQHSRVFILVGAQRTREEVEGTRLGVVQLVKTGIHVVPDNSNRRSQITAALTDGHRQMRPTTVIFAPWFTAQQNRSSGKCYVAAASNNSET